MIDIKGINDIISINKISQIFIITIHKPINYFYFKDDKCIHENPIIDFNYNLFNNMVLTVISNKMIVFNFNNFDETYKINNFIFMKLFLIKSRILFYLGKNDVLSNANCKSFFVIIIYIRVIL